MLLPPRGCRAEALRQATSGSTNRYTSVTVGGVEKEGWKRPGDTAQRCWLLLLLLLLLLQ